jgi:hypothetical protein
MIEPADGATLIRRVVRDGVVVAVLRMLEHGGTTTVVAELFTEGPNGPQSSGHRPYQFAKRDEAEAFVDDTLGTFTYLGCEIESAA